MQQSWESAPGSKLVFERCVRVSFLVNQSELVLCYVSYLFPSPLALKHGELSVYAFLCTIFFCFSFFSFGSSVSTLCLFFHPKLIMMYAPKREKESLALFHATTLIARDAGPYVGGKEGKKIRSVFSLALGARREAHVRTHLQMFSNIGKLRSLATLISNSASLLFFRLGRRTKPTNPNRATCAGMLTMQNRTTFYVMRLWVRVRTCVYVWLFFNGFPPIKPYVKRATR